MTDFSGVKKGDRVRLVYEVDVYSVVGGDFLDTHNGVEFYGTDLVSVEKIAPPLPTEDGWYEAERHPLSAGCVPYELRDGGWYGAGEDTRLAEEYVSKFLAPLYRLGRVDV